jgi:2-iminobutanoate/2-iminopropanoate deaminase
MATPLRRLHPEGLGAELGLYSHVSRVPIPRGSELVVVAGMLPVDPSGATVEGGIEEQTAAVFANLLVALRAAGADLASVLGLRTFLVDRADLHGFALARRRVFERQLSDGVDPPSNTLVFVAGLLAEEHRIEVEALAISS